MENTDQLTDADAKIIDSLTQYYFIEKKLYLEPDGHQKAMRCAIQEFERNKNFMNDDPIWKLIKDNLSHD